MSIRARSISHVKQEHYFKSEPTKKYHNRVFSPAKPAAGDFPKPGPPAAYCDLKAGGSAHFGRSAARPQAQERGLQSGAVLAPEW
jgi:hypothetical protein